MYRKEDHFTIIEDENQRENANYYGEFFCILDGKTYKSIRGLMNALRPFKITSEEYYRQYYMIPGEDYCEMNPEHKTKFEGLVKGYNNRCNKCAECLEEIRKKQSESAKRPETIKMKVDAMRIWRAENPDLVQDSIARQVQTTIERYGEDYLSNRVKDQWTNKTAEERKKIGERSVETKRKNGTLNVDLLKHTGKKMVIDGQEYFFQGYEDSVALFLHDLGVKFETGSNVPRITSIYNKSGFYRPDFFVKDLNLILEVKSDYTFMRAIDKLSDAHEHALKQGFIYVVLPVSIKNKARELTTYDEECIKGLIDMIISSQAQSFFEKVQRLGGDSPYRPIAIGSGSARVPKERFISFEQLRDMI